MIRPTVCGCASRHLPQSGVTRAVGPQLGRVGAGHCGRGSKELMAAVYAQAQGGALERAVHALCKMRLLLHVVAHAREHSRTRDVRGREEALPYVPCATCGTSGGQQGTTFYGVQ